jgi:hypothetical protein
MSIYVKLTHHGTVTCQVAVIQLSTQIISRGRHIFILDVPHPQNYVIKLCTDPF